MLNKAKVRLKKNFNLAVFSKKEFVFASAIGLTMNLMNIGSALLYGQLISDVAAGKTFSDMMPMIIVTVIYTLVFCSIMWLNYYYGDNVYARNLYGLRNEFVDKLLATRYANIASDDSAKYINNLTNDVNQIVFTYSNCTQFMIYQICMVVGTFIAATVLDWRIALSMVGFTLIMAILPLLIKKKLDKAIYQSSICNRNYIMSLKENLLGLPVIKNCNAEKECGEIIRKFNEDNLKIAKKKNLINSFASGGGNLVRNVAVVSLIIITCYFVSIKQVQVGAVLSIYSIGSMFYGAILGFSSVVTNLTSMKGVRDIIEEVVDLEIDSRRNKINFNDSVNLENVSFKYKDSDDRLILDNVNMKINKNGKYLVIGKSGSGKSTILKLICKFYDVGSGSVSMDGKGYDEYSEIQINSVIAYCQQSGYLFNRTLKDNIDFKGEKDEQKLHEILKLARLEEFVENLPNGLDTVIDEEVNQVSGGEKLRINLARSLYRDSDMLLLDEVTSALDKKTSETVEKNLLSLNKTIVNVCHKFNDDTLPLYDRIYIIENGKIVEEGDYDTLKDSECFIKYRNLSDKKS